MDEANEGRRRDGGLGLLGRVLGTALQAAVLLVIAVSGLVAPPWAVAVGVAVWLVSLIAFVDAVRARPWRSVLVALAVLATWIGIVTLGDLVLGWTA